MMANGMEKYATISVELREDVESLSLNRPDALNAVTPAMIEELTEYFSGLHQRLTTRVVILRGNGRAFCAGAELGSEAFSSPGEGRPQRQFQMQQRYSGVIRLMRSCPQPIIALVQGPACGAGFSLMLASDVRFAAPEARMNAAYIRVGVGGCDMGSGYLLPRLIGLSVASELLLTGRFLGADRAKAVGTRQRCRGRRQIARNWPRLRRRNGPRLADGFAPDQANAERTDRRSRHRCRADDRGPSAGDAA